MTEESPEPSMRERAEKRVKEKRDFYGHLLTYVVVNLFLVFIWWMSGGGYLWFLWVIAGWGIAVVIQAVTVFGFPSTGVKYESAVDAEMERMRRTGPG